MGDDERDGALHEARMRLLERVAETAGEDGSYRPTRLLGGLPDEATQAETFDGLYDLDAAGLLVEREERSLADDRWTISPAGHSALRERERLRGDVRARNKRCRLAIVEWLYAVKHDDRPLDEGNWHRFGEIEGNVWFGRPSPDGALDKASRSLYDEGLIDGISSFGHDRIERPEITSRGEAWLDDQQGGPPAPAGPGWVLTGDHNVVKALTDSPGGIASQRVSISDDSRTLLLQRLDGLTRALDVDPLPDEAAQAQAHEAVREARTEAEADEPDRGRLAAAMQRVADAVASGVGSAGGSALVTGMLAGATQAWQAIQ